MIKYKHIIIVLIDMNISLDVWNMIGEMVCDYSLHEIAEIGETFLSDMPVSINFSKNTHYDAKYKKLHIVKRSTREARKYICAIAIYYPRPNSLLILSIAYNLEKSCMALSPFQIHGIFKNIRNRGGRKPINK
jgi:hypothetical protein